MRTKEQALALLAQIAKANRGMDNYGDVVDIKAYTPMDLGDPALAIDYDTYDLNSIMGWTGIEFRVKDGKLRLERPSGGSETWSLYHVAETPIVLEDEKV